MPSYHSGLQEGLLELCPFGETHFHGKTLANLHSKKEGPPCQMIRGKAFYEKAQFVLWLRAWATKGRSR